MKKNILTAALQILTVTVTAAAFLAATGFPRLPEEFRSKSPNTDEKPVEIRIDLSKNPVKPGSLDSHSTK